MATEGKLIHEKIVVPIGSGCDEPALRAIKNIPDEWIHAKNERGKYKCSGFPSCNIQAEQIIPCATAMSH